MDAWVARRSCWSVGHFFPRHVDLFQPRACQEQMADHRHDQVSLDGAITPALEVVEPQQPLFILEASFDVPAREGHMQHAFDRRGG